MNPAPDIQPGQRVRVRQRIRQQDRWLELTVEGEVVKLQRRPTGSRFAHGHNWRLWLDRLVVRKADGEESELVIDERTEIERV